MGLMGVSQARLLSRDEFWDKAYKEGERFIEMGPYSKELYLSGLSWLQKAVRIFGFSDDSPRYWAATLLPPRP